MPITILCVDDERQILRTLERFCRNEGFEMIAAASAAEGLDLLRRERADIILSDFLMPGMNGIDFLRQARMMAPASVRILLSGYADIPAVTQAVEEGEIFAFIPKPWDREALRQVILSAVARPQKGDS